MTTTLVLSTIQDRFGWLLDEPTEKFAPAARVQANLIKAFAPSLWPWLELRYNWLEISEHMYWDHLRRALSADFETPNAIAASLTNIVLYEPPKLDADLLKRLMPKNIQVDTLVGFVDPSFSTETLVAPPAFVLAVLATLAQYTGATLTGSPMVKLPHTPLYKVTKGPLLPNGMRCPYPFSSPVTPLVDYGLRIAALGGPNPYQQLLLRLRANYIGIKTAADKIIFALFVLAVVARAGKCAHKLGMTPALVAMAIISEPQHGVISRFVSGKFIAQYFSN